MTNHKGIIAKTSRRFVDVVITDGSEIQGTEIRAIARTKVIETTVGDQVSVEKNHNEWSLTEIQKRTSELVRCYRDERVTIAANVSRAFLIVSVAPRLNLTFLDRVLTATAAAGIPTTLLINKVDLGVVNIDRELEFYRNFTDMLMISAKFEKGLDEVHARLQNESGTSAVLVGMSGAGKSTLLNKLVPSVMRRTADVSEKTGFGKQTTSQSEGFWYKEDGHTIFLVDSPGVQNFGVMHLSLEEIRDVMTDIGAAAANCGFDNCSHRSEADCGVVRAVEEGTVLASRYHSFCNMCEEVESMKRWEREKRVRK